MLRRRAYFCLECWHSELIYFYRDGPRRVVYRKSGAIAMQQTVSVLIERQKRGKKRRSRQEKKEARLDNKKARRGSDGEVTWLAVGVSGTAVGQLPWPVAEIRQPP